MATETGEEHERHEARFLLDEEARHDRAKMITRMQGDANRRDRNAALGILFAIGLALFAVVMFAINS